MRFSLILCVTLFFLFGVSVFAQENTPPVPRKNPPVTATARLAAARTVFLKNVGGSSIPYTSISSAVEGWGRFTMVESADKADLIIEVSSPSGGNGVSVSSKTDTSSRDGRPENSSSTTKELGSGPVRMTVIDGKSKSVLWMGSEQPKFAMRKKSQEDNLVEASETLFTKFHDRVEPNLAK